MDVNFFTCTSGWHPWASSHWAFGFKKYSRSCRNPAQTNIALLWSLVLCLTFFKSIYLDPNACSKAWIPRILAQTKGPRHFLKFELCATIRWWKRFPGLVSQAKSVLPEGLWHLVCEEIHLRRGFISNSTSCSKLSSFEYIAEFLAPCNSNF